ncbi:FAD dependent oxidoreductase [Halothece sp. PCC 7418]|uniref:NAD(P)/FAD-dependent oxidoreductase n=1 Tax=Halothece sp. (strain PCC 7418) TaxID=65093 RepID=UPI0002A07DE7|nr:FAD-binding oxidoreductase [Halothece sp. PCC 7418]AFZ43804.1 FAD dependent oxidoreductase [Halothece sp. PCC 7418]
MVSYDWLVIGGGITGSTVAYELQAQGATVLLLESSPDLDNATCYSYGGLPFWAGSSPETRELCAEGLKLHRNLSNLLDQETEFREINLLLTVRENESVAETVKQYQDCEIPPQVLSVEESCELEPLLNPSAIAGSICFPHGHINPKKTNAAYLKAFTRLGGKVIYEAVQSLQFDNNKVIGVNTNYKTYYADNTVICAGGFTRELLTSIGVHIPLYFTHAELLETDPLELELKTLIMPANDQRLGLETTATAPDKEALWEKSGQELAAPVLDPGAIQFRDGHLCIGQISRTLSDPDATVDAAASEAWLREEIGTLLPALKDVPANWHRCLIAFSPHQQSIVSKLENYEGLSVFSGFTSPLLFAPVLARRFAKEI